MPSPGQAAFDVRIGNLLFERVFFIESMSAREVRKALIDHDGLPSTISVYKQHPSRPAYTDCARVSHPEEL